MEAVKSALSALPQDRVILRFLYAAPGEVNESDIDLAAASNGIVLAFGAAMSDKVTERAKVQRVEVRSYDVIYGLVDEVRAAMEGKLSGVQDEVFVGKAECKAVFGGGNSKVRPGTFTSCASSSISTSLSSSSSSNSTPFGLTNLMI